MDTYEKKYKGALARCKWLLSEGMISKIAATDMFRELMDNDSENIRKEIINIFHSLAEGKIPVGINYADIFTWLEKQGNSPIKWNKNTEGNKPQVNHSVLMKTTHSIAEGEWKGEYWEQYRWAGIVRDSDVLSWMELFDLDKQGKQKPTLRERYKNIAESEWFKKTHEGMSVFDDEKVDNVNKIEQKSVEWSEEDEKVWKELIEEVKDQLDSVPSPDCRDKEDEKALKQLTRWLVWLKSLKERYTWKPSDEQMKFLQKCIEAYNEVTFPTEVRVLSSLYNDLKKLKGE